MRAHTENSVMMALADVIDLEKARARRAEEAHRQREAEERAARQARKQAEELARQQAERQTRLEQARQARQQAEARQAALREDRFQEHLAERMRRIEAETEAEIAELRLSHVHRRRRFGRWIAPTAVAAMLLLVGAVGCLVGTALQPSHAETPVLHDLKRDHRALDAAKAKARAQQQQQSYEAALAALPAPNAHEHVAKATATWPRALQPTRRVWRPRPRPVVTTKAPRPPRPNLCSQLGALGCLRD